MKRLVATSVLTFCSFLVVIGQDRLSNWVFADSVGINFDNHSVFETSMSSINAPFGDISEAESCISSSQGDLALYSNGDKVWNANGDVIVDSLKGYTSCSNGVLILPSITDSNQYVVITIYDGLYATTVDVTLNAGVGGVVSGLKNILLLQDTLDERVIAVRHANGRDWWILTSEQFTSRHYIFLYSPQGIQLSQEQFIGNAPFNPSSPAGEITSSPAGNLIANCAGNTMSVFDFDRCNGNLSNYRNYVTGYSSLSIYYGCSISPNGNRLYFSNWDTLFQSTITPDSLTTPIVIWVNPIQTSNVDSLYSIWAQELASDGKIYISYVNEIFPNSYDTYFLSKLCVIAKPDFEGLGCDFQPWSFDLDGKRVYCGLPNMPNYNLGTLEGSDCDTLNTIALVPTKSFDLTISPNPSNDLVQIQCERKISRIIIYDVLGRAVYQNNEASSRFLVSTKSFTSGLYFVKVETDFGILTKKFICAR